jgi:hypothetical protein
MSDPIRQKYSDNLAWFKEHYHMLKEKHKGKLCLVIDGEGEIFGDIHEKHRRTIHHVICISNCHF